MPGQGATKKGIQHVFARSISILSSQLLYGWCANEAAVKITLLRQCAAALD